MKVRPEAVRAAGTARLAAAHRRADLLARCSPGTVSSARAAEAA